jgi:PAS domain S-box-containing protein
MGKQLRILFAQDSEEEVLALLEELRHGGYEVSWERVYSRSLTKSALSRREWDVVIASYEMSRLSSLDILEILREKGLATPMVIVSEYLEEESVVNAIKSGAQDFVLRSNLTRLLSVIENCLQNTNNKPLRNSSNHSSDISGEHLMLALEGNNAGLWDWDIQTGKIHFTPPWENMFGYEAGELDPDIHSWHRLVHPDDIVDVQRVLEEHLEGQSVYYETEHRIRSKQGEWIWIQDRGRVVERNSEGRPLRVIGTYMDISSKKRAESSVHLKSLEFETIFRAIPDAVVFASSSREIIMVNPAFTRLLGYKPDEVYGKKSAFLYAERKDFEELKNVDAIEKFDLREIRYKKKNGEVFACEAVRTPVNDAQGTTIGFVEIIRDISRRQKAEKGSQKSEKQFRYLLEAAPQAILVTDEKGKILLANVMAEKLYGYNRNALIGQPVEMLIPERLQDKHIQHRLDYMRKPRSRKMGTNLNLTSINKEGTEFPVEVSLSYIKIEGKTYVMSFITNISDRKKIGDAQQESGTSYLRLFEEDLTGNFVMTPDGKLLTCNLTFARIFGFASAKEAKKTNFFSLHADPQFKSSFLKLLNEKKRLEFHEIELRHQEGRTIYIVENVIGLFDEKGKLEKIRGYFFDGTENGEPGNACRQYRP